MDKLFIIKFAFRNLKQHRLRAILTLLGVIIGISAIVFLVSFAFGIEKLVTNQVTGGNAFLLIDVGTGNSQIVTLTDAAAGSIKNIGGVSNVYGMATVGAKAKVGDQSMDVSFYGADPIYLDKAGIRAMKGVNLTGTGNELIVNTAYAKFLNADTVIGKDAAFDIIIPKELIGKSDNEAVTDQTYHIVGLINDDSTPKVFTNFESLRSLGIKSFSQFKVEVTSQNRVPEIRKQIENMGLKTQYVGDTVTQINQVFGIFRAILAAFGLVTLVVAILGMFNTLTISLLERIKEIALMKMLGMRKKDINSIFLTESLLLGFSGGLVGLCFGIAAGKIVNLVLNRYAVSMGGEAVTIFYSPVILIVSVVVLSIIVGLLTGLYPARWAVKVKSLEVLRYE